MKKILKMGVAIITICSMFLGSNVYAAASIQKDESVYVTLTENGEVKERIVSCWIHSDTPNTEVQDSSVLDEIKNIKGNEIPEKNGDNLVWRMEGTDLYYQGLTEKELPLEVAISYTIDGNKINVEDLAGKSGRVEINLEIKNNDKHIIKVNGINRALHTPFVVASIINLPSKHFKNVHSSSGEIVSDGVNQVVTFISFPGLNESLNLDRYNLENLDLNFPEKLSIIADVENFEMGQIMIIATPSLPDMDKLKETEDIDELREGLNDLLDAGGKLADGAEELADGIEEARKKFMEPLEGKESLKELVTNSENVTGSRILIDDAKQLLKLDTSIIHVLTDYVTPSNVEMLLRLSDGYKGLDMDYVLNDTDFRNLPKLMNEENCKNTQKMMSQVDKLLKLDMRRLMPMAGVMNSAGKLLPLSQKTIKLMKGIEESRLAPILGLIEQKKPLEQLLKGAPELNGQVDIGQLTGFMVKQKIEGEAYVYGTCLFGVDKTLLPALENNSLSDRQKAILNNVVNGTLNQKAKFLEASIASGKLDDSLKYELSSMIDLVIGTQNAESAEALKFAINKDKLDEVVQKELLAIVNAVIDGNRYQISEKVNKNAIDAETRELLKMMVIAAGLDTKGLQDSVANSNMDPEAKVQIEAILQANGVYRESTIATAPIMEKVGDNLDDLINLQKYYNKYLKGNNVDAIFDSIDYLEGLLPEVKELKNELVENADSIEMLEKGLSKEDLDYLNQMIPSLLELKKTMDESSESLAALNKLIQKMDDPKLLNMKEQIEAMEDDLSKSRVTIKDMQERLLDDPIMRKNVENSPETLNTLAIMENDIRTHSHIIDLTDQVLEQDNIDMANELIDKVPDIREGFNKLADGSMELAENMRKFQNEGIIKIHDELTDRLDDIDELLIVKDEIIRLSEEYNTFTGLGKDMEGKTKFIMKTDEIKIPKVDVVVTENNEKTERGFFSWLKGIFKDIFKREN